MPHTHYSTGNHPMRRFANLFLTLFLVDGVISVADEFVTLLSQETFFSGLRTLVAGVVIVMAIPMYISLGIDRRLPKRVFLPLILFLFWCSVGTWFFPFLAKNSVYSLLMSVCQVLLCYLPLSHFHYRGRFGMQLPETLFSQPFFGLRNCLFFGSANLIITPFALLLIALTVADSVIGEKTAGFVRLTPAGLCMTERIYRLDSKTVRLVSMIHVGDQEFYSDLFKTTAAGRTIVLAEGVADEENLLSTAPKYGKMAGYLGLTSQEGMSFKGRQIHDEDIGEPDFDPGKAGIPDILRADVDVSTFSPSTVHFLEAIGKLLKESDSAVQGILALNAW